MGQKKRQRAAARAAAVQRGRTPINPRDIWREMFKAPMVVWTAAAVAVACLSGLFILALGPIIGVILLMVVTHFSAMRVRARQ